MTEDEVRHIAKLVAREMVHETMVSLGINPADPIAAQKDAAFIRSWRQSTEAVKRQGIISAVGVIVVGVLGLIWLAIKGPAI